jgi:hypothetical protein
MTFILGLAGPGHVGKSTTSKNLVKQFNELYPDLKVCAFAFATPIYNMVSELTGIPIKTLKDEIYKETPWTTKTTPMPCLIDWTPRKFLQVIGTECFRKNIHENFWVEAAICKLKNFDIVISEDSRFDNEYQIANKVIELVREKIEYLKNHASAMPPNQKYIWKQINLTPDINYNKIVTEIYEEYKGNL